ncbi:MAG: hypothetical protein AAGC55_04065 [Myxococcota bacterium]
MTSRRSKSQPITISLADVEREIYQLFGDPSDVGLVIRVLGGDGSAAGRTAAFRELLNSLQLYDFHESKDIAVAAPDSKTIASALAILGQPRLKRRLFEHILLTFGKSIVDPLGEILDTTPSDSLLTRMSDIRAGLFRWITDLKLTHETQDMLLGDLRQLLSDEYLAMLAEHEENVQRPRATELAQQILHLVGSTFERAFRQWPEHATVIADSVARRMGGRLSLRESPHVIRDRIIDGIQEFLWIETSTELSGALRQLFSQPQFVGITGEKPERLERTAYREFAAACWDIITENC